MIAFGYEVALAAGKQWITAIRLGTSEAGKATHLYRLDAPLEDTDKNRPEPCAEWSAEFEAGELVEL